MNNLILETHYGQALLENYSREEFLDMLGSGTMVISFKKRSNDRWRLLYCTRDPERIPTRYRPQSPGSFSDQDKRNGLIRVFDLIKKKWRSFGVEEVKQAREGSPTLLARIFRRRIFKKDSGSEIQESVSYQGEIFKENLLLEEFLLEESGLISASSKLVNLTVKSPAKMAQTLRNMAKAIRVQSSKIASLFEAMAEVTELEANPSLSPKGKARLKKLKSWVWSEISQTIAIGAAAGGIFIAPIPGTGVIGILALFKIAEKYGFLPSTWKMSDEEFKNKISQISRIARQQESFTFSTSYDII